MYNSPIYRQRVKRMVEAIKVYKFTQTGKVMGKLPRRAHLDKKVSDADLEKFRKENQFKVDKEVAHYFAQPMEASMDRRVISGGNDEVVE